MTSPSMVQRSGDTLIIRSVVSGNRLFVDGDESKTNNLEAELEDTNDGFADDVDLPDCKSKLNYNCNICKFSSNNPRHYLSHLREMHKEKLKMYECPLCVYASKRSKSLLTHMRVSHENEFSSDSVLTNSKLSQFSAETNAEQKEIDDDENEVLQYLDPLNAVTTRQHCSVCSFQAESVEELTAHERKEHLMTKFFPCSKCNYVTHIKARYTKHVKYHSMPMIKCNLCDFATPYKWNLDRHMRNHGGSGSFCCGMCNFTADIKQSLTVHEMNHHSPPVGHGSNALKKKYKINNNDTTEHNLSKNHTSTNETCPGFNNKIELSNKETMNTDANSDLATLQMFTHGSCSVLMNDNDKLITPNDNKNAIFTNKRKRTPRPIPNLIPLQASTTVGENEPPLKNKRKSVFSENDLQPEGNQESELEIIPISTSKKKSESFFDKLQERLLTAENENLICKVCGFISKCLSEHSVHEKNCNFKSTNNIRNFSLIRSTRCQNCRHRCKSSADLIVHMQNCGIQNGSGSFSDDNKSQCTDLNGDIEENTGNSQNPHPMENIVFVWNTMTQNSNPMTDNKNDSCINDVTDLSIKSCDLETSSQSDLIQDGDASNSSVCKKAFQCPHCSFWASTASRFHVHIVGHLNKKPFECSLCPYRSNWRWDITKHIRLKTIRDPDHANAKVLMTDETGRRNYSKYNKYLRLLDASEQQQDDPNIFQIRRNSQKAMGDDEESHHNLDSTFDVKQINITSTHNSTSKPKKSKRTLWKCKKCNYRNQSKELLLIHVREHSKNSSEINSNWNARNDVSTGIAFRCGHCNQLSNWKHVIQRHCRLKHNGNISVVHVEKPVPKKYLNEDQILEAISDGKCTICPFVSNVKSVLKNHIDQHTPNSDTIFKCYFCPYFVNTEDDLLQHLPLHGISKPEEYVAKILDGGKLMNQKQNYTFKRYKCTECPYDSNSKSQFVYHKQFHKISSNTPYKCPECNYSVTKRHLLHQHLRVHRLSVQKPESISKQPEINNVKLQAIKFDDNLNNIPFVWVSAKNEFHKMYKCRYCSYVNTQKSKIPNHEKLHSISLMDGKKILYKCLDCKFTCQEKKKLALHSNRHEELYGKIHCLVDPFLTEDEQIKKMHMSKSTNLSGADSTKDNIIGKLPDVLCPPDADKKLHFCICCPARFLSEQGWRVHAKFHSIKLPFSCSVCSYSARQEGQLLSHQNVHTEDYQNKTKILQKIHGVHKDYKQPKIVTVISGMNTSESVCIVVSESNSVVNNTNCENELKRNKEMCPEADPDVYQKGEADNDQNLLFVANGVDYPCNQCPAKFSKLQALNNHKQNHGGVGDFKCKKCNYSVKTNIYLVKHEMLHDQTENSEIISRISSDLCQSNNDTETKADTISEVSVHKFITRPNDHFPPVLQADPQFGYLMHGNPNFIYPTYIKNGRQKEKRYKCHKCPSAFEKREQYKVHLSLHGSKQRYKCEVCDYSVKYYANYVQHMRKHQMNAEAQAAKKNKIFMSDDISQATPEKQYPEKVQYDTLSIVQQQSEKIMNRKLTIAPHNKDLHCEEKVSLFCPHCPYTSYKKDGLESHIKRHLAASKSSDNGSTCTHCDYVAIHTNQLQEHLKIHFMPQNIFQPNGFFKVENVSFIVKPFDKNYVNINNSSEELSVNPMQRKLVRPNRAKSYILPLSGEVINC